MPNLITLTCPSCNGQLELLDNLGMAHCMYCGTKILLPQSSAPDEKAVIQKYKELCKTALHSKNCNELIQYCNSILELDPKDADAWIDKAIGTFYLTTIKDNRYGEAIEYLRKAIQLSPNNSHAYEVRSNLTHEQAMWYNNIAIEEEKIAVKIWNAYIKISKARALQESKDYFAIAMERFFVASNYAPDDVVILENIEHCSKNSRTQWTSNVYEKIAILNRLREKKKAGEILPDLREKFNRLNIEVNELKKNTGIFNESKIKKVERELQKVQSEIDQKEKMFSYKEPEKLKFEW